MNRYIVAGNWKMNAGPEEATALASEIRDRAIVSAIVASEGAVVLCPPAVSIAVVAQCLLGSPLHVGAQNCHHELAGAYTGELSTNMLLESGASWTIIGHSERRRDQGETNELIGQKLHACVESGLTPIVCIGESLKERKEGSALEVVEQQLREIHASCETSSMSKCVIAYEPVWAIGTGEAATPAQAEEVHAHIKSVLGTLGCQLPVLYGGSVKASNVASIFDMPSIDGALVGGAALSADEFCAIIAAAEERSHS